MFHIHFERQPRSARSSWEASLRGHYAVPDAFSTLLFRVNQRQRELGLVPNCCHSAAVLRMTVKRGLGTLEQGVVVWAEHGLFEWWAVVVGRGLGWREAARWRE